MTAEPLRRSRAQEKRGAKAFGGQVTPGSGNGWRKKNDVQTEKFSIEFKTTSKGSYSLKYSELVAAERNALVDNRTMLFGVELGGRNWIVISEEDFHELTRKGDEC